MHTVHVAPKTYCVRVDIEGTNRLLWPQFHVMSDGTCHVMSMSGFKYLTTCANLDAAIEQFANANDQPSTLAAIRSCTT